jgi:ATP-grasp domain, R2K clade family 3
VVSGPGRLADLRVLFCADPLAPTRIDEHFADQAEAVRKLGGQIALIDHDALLRGDAAAAVRRVPREGGPWWYRGWMIPTASYVELSAALGRREATLRVPPHRYRSAHELPGWYTTFQHLTPDSVWMASTAGTVPSEQDLTALARSLGPGPAVVKDYVKSRKHEWDEACFIPEVTDVGHTAAVVARMVELQEDTLNGGIVLRRFENYRQENGRTIEARVWWVDGEPALLTAHPDTPDLHADPDMTAVMPLVAALGCSFVTTDLAQRIDGQWRVVEVGDGQVSDLPKGVDPTVLFQRLATSATSRGLEHG